MRSNNSQPLEVLIVDDDKVIALLHKNQLKALKTKSSPVICSNGMEALEYLVKNDNEGKNFLLFLDLNMPVVDGWKVLKRLMENPPESNVYIIIVTSSINQNDYLKAQTYASVIHFCRKPLDLACLTRIKTLEPLRKFFKWELKETEAPEK